MGPRSTPATHCTVGYGEPNGASQGLLAINNGGTRKLHRQLDDARPLDGLLTFGGTGSNVVEHGHVLGSGDLVAAAGGSSGTINTQGVVGDVNLTFNNSVTKKATGTLNGVIYNVDLSSGTASVLGAGWSTTGYATPSLITINNGAAVTTLLVGIAYNSGSNGSVTVDGSGSSWTANNAGNCVGYLGNGYLQVSNGALFNATTGYLYLGQSAGGSGTVAVTGTGSSGPSAQFYVGLVRKRHHVDHQWRYCHCHQSFLPRQQRERQRKRAGGWPQFSVDRQHHRLHRLVRHRALSVTNGGMVTASALTLARMTGATGFCPYQRPGFFWQCIHGQLGLPEVSPSATSWAPPPSAPLAPEPSR